MFPTPPRHGAARERVSGPGGVPAERRVRHPGVAAFRKDRAKVQALARNQGVNTLPKAVHAFGISGGIGHGLRRLFMSHPPLEERIAALQKSVVA